MSRPPRVSYIEHPSRGDSDSVQHGHSTLTWRPRTQKKAWRVDEVREVIVRTSFPCLVAIRLSTGSVELAGFRDGADAEACADALSHALGFPAGPTRG